MQSGGHKLGHHVGLGVGKVQGTANVPDGTPGSHGAEGSNLGNMVGAVFAHDVLYDLAPAFLAEVRIEIGHTDTFGIQEPFEDQGVLHGVHFGDVHAVGHDGGRAGATAGAYGDPLLFGIADEVPDDQIVVDIAHAADNADLVFQAVNVLLGRVFVAFLEAVIAQLPEIGFVGIALRYREGRQMVFVEGKFQIAAVGNFYRIFEGFAAVREQLAQLFLALEVKFLGLELHAVFIVHSFAGLDAQQDVLHLGILFAQIVGIVGDHQRQAGLPGQALYTLIHGALLVNTVILQFQVEVAFAENVRQLQGVVLGGIVIFLHEVLRDSTRQTGGQGDEALVVLFQQRQIHTGFAVEAVDKGFGHQQTQVFIARPVLAQQHQMVRIIVDAVDTVGHAAAGDIDLAADDRLYPGCFRRFIEIDTAIHDTVVGDGYGGLAQFLHPVHQAVDAAGTVQEAVFGMYM